MRGIIKAVQRAIGRFPAIHRALRFVWSPPRTIYRHLHFEGRFNVEVQPGVTFELMSRGELVENELFWRGYGGTWEASSLRLWRDLAGKACFIVDVGANTGVFALAAQAINPGAKVLAVEPSSRVFARLQENIRLNGFPIMAVEIAASDTSGEATFYDFEGEHQYSASLEAAMGGTKAVLVRTETLDSLIERHGFPKVDLIKVDVEMHEAAVLLGLRRTIERCRPTLLLEILTPEVEQGIRKALDGIPYRWEPILDEEGRNYLLTPA